MKAKRMMYLLFSIFMVFNLTVAQAELDLKSFEDDPGYWVDIHANGIDIWPDDYTPFGTELVKKVDITVFPMITVVEDNRFCLMLRVSLESEIEGIIEEIRIETDNATYEVPFENFVGCPYPNNEDVIIMSELTSTPLTPTGLEMLKDIISSKAPVVQLFGRVNSFEITLKQETLDNMKKIYDDYVRVADYTDDWYKGFFAGIDMLVPIYKDKK
ncbi:MAG: hypothetical protein GX786_02600 [Clostridiales bacterium]|nr:hypothetical protein [Clostridiales bacterium]